MWVWVWVRPVKGFLRIHRWSQGRPKGTSESQGWIDPVTCRNLGVSRVEERGKSCLFCMVRQSFGDGLVEGNY